MKILKGAILVFVFLLVSQVEAQDDMKKAEKKFGWMNTDKNDFLDIAEFEAFYKDKKTKKDEPMKWELMFLGTDADGDGKVTLEELAKPIDWKLAKERSKATKE